MSETIKYLHQLARMLNEIRIDTHTLPITLKSVDIELDYNDYSALEWHLNKNIQSFKFKYIRPTVSIENGRMRGYLRVVIDGFTFNVYLTRDDYEPVFKEPKPHSRFY